MIDLSSVRMDIDPDTITRIPNVPDEEYFGEEYKQYVSNSILKYINPDEGGSPYIYANRINSQSSSLELGSAVHKAVLEGDKYVLAEVSKPSGKLVAIVEKAYTLYLENSARTYEKVMLEAMLELDYYGEARTATRADAAIEAGEEYFKFLVATKNNNKYIVLSIEQRVKFLKAIDSIKGNKNITELLNPSSDVFNVLTFSEDVLTGLAHVSWQEDDEWGSQTNTGVPIKCKIDNWTIDFDNKVITLNDLKTSSYPIQDFMGKWVKQPQPITPESEVLQEVDAFLPGSFQKWHYYRQMAMYVQMLVLYCKKEYKIVDLESWTINVNMIVSETVPPFNAYTYKVTDAWLTVGSNELEELFGRIAWHRIYGFDKVIELERRSIKTGSTV